jgi:hypothetical protein
MQGFQGPGALDLGPVKELSVRSAGFEVVALAGSILEASAYTAVAGSILEGSAYRAAAGIVLEASA